MKHILIDIWHAGGGFLEPLIPGGLGAAVAQAWEKGISWKQRLIQWGVGVLVAAYLAPALGSVFHWGQPVVSAVGFVMGTLAFKAVPILRDAAIHGAAGGLRSLPEVFRSWTRKPGVGPEVLPDKPDQGEG